MNIAVGPIRPALVNKPVAIRRDIDPRGRADVDPGAGRDAELARVLAVLIAHADQAGHFGAFEYLAVEDYVALLRPGGGEVVGLAARAQLGLLGTVVVHDPDLP